ncbi:UAA-domain-containing protein [Meredithblackwellia eburnea MCA 4105]
MVSGSLLVHAVGLLTAYTLYGLLQERIMRGSYGPANQRFTSSSVLIVVNRIFSIATALVILFTRKDTSPIGIENQPRAQERWRRLYPASPLLAYAAVAIFNFLSTTSQYEALKYVSYTTQSLAKCAKMVPVLLVGAVIHKKTHRPNEWIAGAVILLGCAAYLFSQPPHVSTSTHQHSAPAEDASSLEALLGALCLAGYLFFDGLVSTTQEKVFGKNPSVSDPFGSESPVLDQMIWTNVFALSIALVTSILTTATGNVKHDVYMLFTTPALVRDVCAFSAASAVGLAILLNTIASFDALTASLIMTIRQFLSIVLNAGVYGNFSSVGVVGWMGVAWVASGVYIKMKRVDLPTPGSGGKNSNTDGPPVVQKVTIRHISQYIVPITLPVILGLSSNFLILHQSSSLLSRRAQIRIEGGVWDAEMHSLVGPECEHSADTSTYNTTVKTGLVTFPRSGNSYLRSLVERSTGYRTSSVYCDPGLQQTFVGECDRTARFLVKTHFPSLPQDRSPGDQDHYKNFDQAVHLIRNPFDAVASWWHMEYAESTSAVQNHEGKVELEGGEFDPGDRPRLIEFAKKWRNHALYWQQAPIRTHTVRYEDLRRDTIPQMMSLLPFLLPPDDRPSLERVTCLAEKVNKLNPYKSRKMGAFSAWSSFYPSLRMEILYITRRPFCAHGYLPLLLEAVGEENVPELKGFCDRISFDMSADGYYVDDARKEDVWDVGDIGQ